MLVHHAKPLPFFIQYLSGGTRLLCARWAAGQVLGERKRAMLLSCMRVYSLQTEHPLYIFNGSVCLLIPSPGGFVPSSFYFAVLVAFAKLLLIYHVYCGRIDLYRPCLQDRDWL